MATPDALFLGLATATATIAAAGATLGLLRPESTRGRLWSLVVLLAVVLGVSAALLTVATNEQGGLNVVIGLGIAVPGLDFLMRAIGEILGAGRGNPALVASPGRTQRTAAKRPFVVGLGVTFVAAVGGLGYAADPDLLDSVLDPQPDPPASAIGYAPSDRPVFTCIRPTNCPGPGYVVFNSYVNNPAVGDERPFVSAKLASSRGNVKEIVKVQPGQLVTIRLYFDNDADAKYARAGESTTSRSARMLVLLPTSRHRVLGIAGQISADNATPRFVSDGVTLWSDEKISVEYVLGTARVTNRAHPAGLALSDALVSDSQRRTRGTLLGYQQMDGRIAGDFAQSGYVTLQVKVI